MATTSEQVAGIVRECLLEGRRVEIDGLGTFQPGQDGSFEFVAQTRPKVFLAYVLEDQAHVTRLFDQLREAGFDPWVDHRKLLPGQNWPRAIERAISVSDFFVACFSRRAISKKGRFHAELRYALDCASHTPLDEVYFIPVRLDECDVPARITREIQYVDLFPDWDKGFRRVVSSMKRQMSSAGGVRWNRR